MVPVMRRIVVLGSLALCFSTVGCTSNEPPATPPAKEAGGKTEEPKPEPTPEPVPEPTARAAIASVQMIQDCPNDNNAWRPPPADTGAPAAQAPAAQAVPAQPMPPVAGDVAAGSAARSAGASADGSYPSFVQPCTQSTMQMVFAGQGDRSSKVQIEVVRLLDPKSGKEVATIEAREPAAWTDGAYQSWNETIGPRQEVKASYELSVPDWSEVEKTLGLTSSYGTMFLLEVDVKVGDELQTVRSPQFPREQEHVIVT
jgi:hypothetical protein